MKAAWSVYRACRRVLFAALRRLVHSFAQGLSLSLEIFARMTGQDSLAAEEVAVRRAARLSWLAESYARKGKTSEALTLARQAFEALKATDFRVTFMQQGFGIAVQLHELARQQGEASMVLQELEEVLGVLKDLRKGAISPRGVAAMDQAIGWLEERVAATAREE